MATHNTNHRRHAMTAKTRAPKCYRDGLIAVVACCVPDCYAHSVAIADLARFDATYTTE